MDRFEGQKQRKWLIKEGNSSITRVPLSNPLVFGVDEERDTAYLRRNQEAPATRRKQKLAAKAASLYRTIHCQPCKPEHRHIMAGEAMPDKFGSTVKSNRSRADAVEAKNPLAFSVIDGEKCFGSALIMALACMTAQKLIQRGVAAVEGLPIIGP